MIFSAHGGAARSAPRHRAAILSTALYEFRGEALHLTSAPSKAQTL